MATWTDLSAIDEPARVAALPRDRRGYPIPHSVAHDEDGVPDFRVIDPGKWQHAVRRRLCGVCGSPLGARLAFVGGPLSIRNRLFNDLPMHRDCATYAMRACPFLAAPRFAFARKLPEHTHVNESVSTDRPERFGLGIARDFQLVRGPAGDILLRAGAFEVVEWWQHGAVVAGP
ncbi:hypothetical protein NY96_19685 [Xanthomonas citri pv. fuscans]|uniref:hypothetical protein n=1 Tax=Xanthomonas TaxID=338 RepID=UPI0003827800|nr:MULTISPECIES: hypothetical protein [Xanthomonas]KGT54005.1 hypothetical protein NY96_19685 [Xanthomonas citri pv. fuscans]